MGMAIPMLDQERLLIRIKLNVEIHKISFVWLRKFSYYMMEIKAMRLYVNL